MDDLDRFRLRVVGDPDLRRRLLEDPDPTRFAVRVVALAHVEGCDVDLESVRAELDGARQRWLSRWI